MEVAEALGFIQFWGMTPSINFLEDDKFFSDKKQINILLSGTSDLRHILKTLFEICQLKEKFKDKEIKIYMHEIKKENIARSCLLLHILNLTNISTRERTELFLDIYGNCFVKEKTSDFISDCVKELMRLFTDEKKCQLPIRKLVDPSQLRMKDRDEFLDVLSSWNKSADFKMGELRDQRLRFHYKDRFDARANITDWDYQMDLKQIAVAIHFYHYKTWRQTGNAFEQRFSSHIIPNRTMGSYIPAKTKKTRDSCLLRGFWGDIIISPYIAFGIETDIEPENVELFKAFNMQQKYTSVDVTNFNFNSFFKMYEDFMVYHLPKEEDQAQAQHQQPKQQALKNISEAEESKEEDEKENKQEIQANRVQPEDSKIEEVSGDPSEIRLMRGFTVFDLKILPICEEMEKLVKKSSLKQCFDVIVVGIPHLSLIKEEEFQRILSPNGTLLYLETPKFMIPIPKKERPEMSKNLAQLPEKWQFKAEPFNKDHHLKLRRIPDPNSNQ